MKKGSNLLEDQQNQNEQNEDDYNQNQYNETDQQQISNSDHNFQLSSSNMVYDQTPQKMNFFESNDNNSTNFGESQNIYNNTNSQNLFEHQDNSLSDDEIVEIPAQDQDILQNQTSQQKRQQYASSQTRSKSKFFKQTEQEKKHKPSLDSSKSDLSISSNSNSSKSSKDSKDTKNSKKSIESNDSQASKDSNDIQSIVSKDSIKSIGYQNSKKSKFSKNTKENNVDDFKLNDYVKGLQPQNKITKMDSINENMKSNNSSENIITNRSIHEFPSTNKPFALKRESKIFSSASSTSNQKIEQGDTQQSHKKIYFTYKKSDKQVYDQIGLDHRRRSFVFTNFLKHGEDVEYEDMNGSALNTKVTPLKINRSGGTFINYDQGSHSNVGQLLTKKTKKQGWNFAVQLKNINRFISKMRDQTSESNFSKLQSHHLKMINDRSFQSEGGSKEFFSHNEHDQSSKILSKMPIFEPDQTLLISFKVCIILIMIIQVFILPIEVGFQIDMYSSHKYSNTVLRIIPVLLFILDCICRMNTGFYQNGTFVEKRRQIIENFNWMLILDFLNIATLGFRITFTTPFQIIVFLIRIILISKKCADVSDNFSLLERYPSAYNLTKLAFILLIVGHVSGCGFHYISTIDVGEHNTNWVRFYNFHHYNILNLYLISIYYSTITMITVGYGDLTPQNQAERVYVICIVIISGTVFAYAVNMIGAIFQEKEKKIADYKQMKFDISNYMINRNISKKTQLKVYNYLDYINKKQNESPEKGQKILNLISENLKNEVYKEFYGKIMTNSKLFHNKFSKEFIEKVSLHMEEQMFAPGEIVYREGDQENPCLYYILKGQVEMFSHRGEIKHFLGYLKEGDSMGHRCFQASQPQEWSVITAEVTHLVYITQQKFLECLQEFPLDQEVFMLTKDDIIFGQNRYINPCYSCGKQTHMVIDCPFIHYQKNKQLFINRHLYSVPEKERRKYKRQHEKKKSLKQIQRVRNSLKVIRTAIEFSYFQNTVVTGSQIKLNDKETDQQFFKKMAKFKFNDENNLVIDSQISEEYTGEEDDDEEQEEENESNENSISIKMEESFQEQGNEFTEIKEEEEENSEQISPSYIRNPISVKKLQKFEDENKIYPIHQSSLLQKTLTNQIRIRQLQQTDQSICPSIDFDKDDSSMSFLNRVPSMDTNNLDKSDQQSKKRSSFSRQSEILQIQKSDSNISFRNTGSPQNRDNNPKILNKQEQFKMKLEPIMLHKNFDNILKNNKIEELFSPFLINNNDDKKISKFIQEASNQLIENQNKSAHKLERQQSLVIKKKNVNQQDYQKSSNFKQYQQFNTNNNIGSFQNLNTPLYPTQHQIINQQPYPNNLSLILSNQSSKQNSKLGINSPAISVYKRDTQNLNGGLNVISAFANNNTQNKKLSSEITGQKVIEQISHPQGINQEQIQKQVRLHSNTQLQQFDQYGDLFTPTAINNMPLQNINQFIQNQQNINVNQLDINNPIHYQILQMIRKNEFQIPDFESMKDYTIYFPQYNCNNVLKKIIKKIAPPIRKKKMTVQVNTKRVRRNSSLKQAVSTPISQH